MVRYFILVKRKTAKSWSGAIPIKNGVPLAKIRKLARQQIRKSFTYRIVSETALKKLMRSKVMKRVKKRRTTKRRTKRKKR